MMIIRHVTQEDYGEIMDIEESNFSLEEAASPKAMKERTELLADTFLVAEIDSRVAAYIVGAVRPERYLSDDIFDRTLANPKTGGFIQVQSLSVSPKYKGQGLGTALLAALKDLAISQNRQGISLTCHDELVSYYEMNGFTDEGESASKHGGTYWYNLVWDAN